MAASAPLFVTAASIAIRNAQAVAEVSRDSLSDLRRVVALRHETVVDETQRLVAALAGNPVIFNDDIAACESVLAGVLNVPDDRYAGLGVFDGDHLVCKAGQIPETAAGTPSHRAADGSVRSGAAALSAGSAILPIVATLPQQRDRTRIFYAAVRLDWLVPYADPGESVWAVSADGRLLPTHPADGVAAPSAEVVATLGGAAEGRSRHPSLRTVGETLYGFDAWPDGLTLIMAADGAGGLAKADIVLTRQLARLGLLLLAGLALVAFGAELLLTRPLVHLAAGVRRWRAGGHFDASLTATGPDELVELARSFEEATAALNNRESELRASAAQQDLLMQEIHHRVKNNLQIIASLLNLQVSRIRVPAAKAEFQAARDRIRALATVHRHLYAHGELHTINMRGFLEELCSQLMQALGEMPTGGRIALQIAAPALQISSDQAVPMALIVTEAVSNAVKYAFPGGRSGHIAVRLEVSPDGQTARLQIDDDGVGIPAGRADTEAGVRDGIGLQLIRGFARQLGAKLEVSEEHGTRYVVDIPLRAPHEPRKADGDVD